MLVRAWRLVGKANCGTEAYQPVPASVLSGKTTLEITINTGGATLFGGDGSALIFDQGGKRYAVSMSSVLGSGQTGTRTLTIPLSAFKTLDGKQTLNTSVPLSGVFHVRFWTNTSFTIDILSVKVR